MRRGEPPLLRRPAAAGLLALPVVVAFSRGGYFDVARARAGIAACVLGLLAALVSPAPLPRSAAGRTAVGGLVALAAWVGASIAWAPLRGPAAGDLQRLVLYAATLVAAVALLRGRPARWVEPAVLSGIAAAAVYGLSERLLPGVVALQRLPSAGDRLAQPLTYWNAMGLLGAMGLVLAAGMAAQGGRAAAAAAATAPVLGLATWLTLSRGALGALALGLAVLLALVPTRAAIRGATIVVAAAAVPPLVAELALTAVLRVDSAPGQGAAMLGLLVVLGAAAARLGLRAPGEGAGVRIARLPAIALGAVGLALALTIFAAASADRGGARAAAPGQSAGRLVSAQSNRYEYWRVAVRAFGRHPLAGIGSSGFRVAWLRERPFAEGVRDAHSLELETAAELGLVGLLALAALLGGTAAAARRALRRHGAAAAPAAAALAAFALHSALDWDWEMPGATLFALVLAGRLIAAAEEPPEPQVA